MTWLEQTTVCTCIKTSNTQVNLQSFIAVAHLIIKLTYNILLEKNKTVHFKIFI